MAKELDRLKFLDDLGREIPDPQPIAIPSGFRKPETLSEQIQRLIRSDKLKEMANEQDFDTFEEAEDFDIDEEMFDPSSPYEEVFDPVLGRGITAAEFREHRDIYQKRFLEAEERAYAEMQRSEALRAKLKQDVDEAMNQKSSRAASERVSNSDGEGNAPPGAKSGV